jgi:RNA-directed DNA polymerase
VVSNGGSPGVDGMSVERFEKECQGRLLAVKERLKTGTYEPKPVKRVWIEKLGSRDKRPLGIPTVTDRIDSLRSPLYLPKCLWEWERKLPKK